MSCGTVSSLGRTDKEGGVTEQESKGGQWGDACTGEEQRFGRDEVTSLLAGIGVTDPCTAAAPGVLKD